MGDINITLKWLNENPYTLDELSDFLNNKGKEAGGLYIWLYGNPKCIRYIGEAKNFRSRFYTHAYNITHGLYTAIECPDKNLRKFYEELNKDDKKIEDNFNKNPIYRPKKILDDEKAKKTRCKFFARLNSKDLEKYVKDIVRGIQMRWNEFKDTEFLFAEILVNNEPADPNLRKEVEACFMLKTADTYKAHWQAFDRTEFWGAISRYPKKDIVYKFQCEGIIHETLRDIGIKEQWEYSDKK